MRQKAASENAVSGRLVARHKLLDQFTGREPFYLLILASGLALGAGGDWPILAAWVLVAGNFVMAAGTLWARARMAS